MPFIVNGVQVEMKVDSGADVNVMSWKCFQAVAQGDTQPLKRREDTLTQLLDYGGNEIKCAGCVTTTIACSRESSKLLETFFVAASRPQSVLSYATSTRLGVLKLSRTVMQVKAVPTFPTMPIKPIKLQIDENVPPRVVIYNNIPAALEPVVEEHWGTLEQRGVIEPVPGNPKWLSRVDIVPKKDGTHRIIIDMRPPNKAIARKFYPMPNPDHVLSRLRGAKYFAKLDLKSAYHHVPLHPDSRYMTAFMTGKGPMQFTRLPFGLNCAPEIFQQVMDNIFRGLEGVVVYLDDILAYAPDAEMLKIRLDSVREVAKKNNLTLNKEKCVDKATSIEFLGALLTSEGCKPLPERVNAIKNFPTPRTYGQLREFIGMVTYISKHLWNISTIMAPLQEPLKGEAHKLKGGKLLEEDWGPAQAEAFEDAKHAVSESILQRGFFDSGHLTRITTDASPVGIAAIVTQVDTSLSVEDQFERVIACTSRSLTQTERNYPQNQREALAVVWGMEKNCYYLIGTEFILVTDCEPLKFIFSNDAKRVSKRIMNRAEMWATRIAQFNFKVEVIRSAENSADIPSRNPAAYSPRTLSSTAPRCITTATVGTVTFTPEMLRRHSALTPEELKEATAQDLKLQNVIAALGGGHDWSTDISEFARFRTELFYIDNLLLRGCRVVIPEKLRSKAMTVAHRSHPGMSTTKHLLRKYVWWPGMDREIEEFIKTCTTCIRLSASDPPEPMLMSDFPKNPWQNIAIDFWSGSDTDPKVLVVADYYSKAIRAKVMKETTSEATIRALEELFDEWGWPQSIKHDNGPQLVSEIFLGWLRANGIKSWPTTPRNAQENGLVERHMRGITRALAIAKIEKNKPEPALKQYICDYNSWPHTVTQLAPRDVLMGRVVKARLPLMDGAERHHSFDCIARERDLKFKAKKKEKEDRKRRARTSNLKAGDEVFIRDHDRRFKTDPNFLSEKFVVTARSGGRLTLKSLANGKKMVRKTVDAKLVPANEHNGTGIRDEVNKAVVAASSSGNQAATVTPQVPVGLTDNVLNQGDGQTAATAVQASPSTLSKAPQPDVGRPQRIRRPPKQFSLLEAQKNDPAAGAML